MALVLVWRATERCDTACAFCAYDATLRRPRRELQPAEALRFGRLTAAWAAARGREVLVSWLGGEPLLWAPLREVSTQLRALGLRIGLTTNGRALADPDWLDWVARSLDEITVSLDGPPAVHDRLRGRPGLGQTVLDAVRALRARRGPAGRPWLRVNSVLMRDTLGRFAELVEALAEAGADELTFNALGGADRPEFFPAHRLRPEDVAELESALPRLRAEARQRGLAVRGGEAYLGRLRATAEGRPMAVDDCGPGRAFWFVEVDGQLAPCSFTAGPYGVPIAELRRIQDLDGLPARLAAARARSLSRWCGDCPSTQVHAKFQDSGARPIAWMSPL